MKLMMIYIMLNSIETEEESVRRFGEIIKHVNDIISMEYIYDTCISIESYYMYQLYIPYVFHC